MDEAEPVDEDNEDMILDQIVAAANAGGLDALTPDQQIWLEDWLWGSGDEEFQDFAWDEATEPLCFSAEDVWMLEGKIGDERMAELENGGALTPDEIEWMRERWLAELKEEPDDDKVPGIWTCLLTASDGTQIRTTRFCYGSGWDAQRELRRIDPV